MTKPVILLLDFTHDSIPDLLTLVRAVIAGSIYNSSTSPAPFSNPPFTKATLQQQMEDLQAKYDAARNRDTIAVAQQDLAEKILLASLKAIARYAAPIVYNDKAAIEATGFHASSDETQPAAEPAQLQFTPEGLVGGGIRLNLGKKGGADSFTVVIVKESDNVAIAVNADSMSISGPAVICTSTSGKMTILSVERKTPYLVYAFATNSAGNSPLSVGMPVNTQS